MIKRYALLGAAALLASACASTPAAGPSPGETPAPTAPTAPAASPVLLNLADTTRWAADERLLPQDPILALVTTTGGSVNSPAGLSMTCNPDNGKITARLGKQPAAKAGQDATYSVRLGDKMESIPGKFAASARTGDADFVFSLQSSDIRAMAQLDTIAFVSDTGDLQWELVKNAAAPVTAKYVASLRDFGPAAQNFLVFCNPK